MFNFEVHVKKEKDGKVLDNVIVENCSNIDDAIWVVRKMIDKYCHEDLMDSMVTITITEPVTNTVIRTITVG